MALAVAAVGIVAVLAVVFGGLAYLRSKPGPRLSGRTVVVHTMRPDARSIKGILHGAYADRWTLRDAMLVQPGGLEVPLGGLQHVPVKSIAWVQEQEPHLEVFTESDAS